MRSPHVTIAISLDSVRANAETIRRNTGVRLIAVVKADAYGLGAERVADALAPVVDDFAYFAIHEARVVRRPGLVLGPATGHADEYRELKLRPAVTSLAEAERVKGLPVAVNVDTGMHWFGCDPAILDDLDSRCDVSEYYCHAETVEGAETLRTLCGDRGKPIHAAATTLLDKKDAWLDAVRPGLALYRGAVRVSAPLFTVRDVSGQAGYSQFDCERAGIMLAGYGAGVRRGPVMINGRRQQVLEAGMNTSFVSVDPHDKVGDEVILLGDQLTETDLAAHFSVRPHEILCRYTAMGKRVYV